MMRGLFSLLAFTLAICGMLVVIAYTASEAYINLRDKETNLNNTLLLGTLGPDGWAPTPLARSSVNEQFISPCLRVPLLEGASISGRGALSYAPAGATADGLQLLMIETSAADARAIMDSVQRDTENDCQRGVTVGTVSQADVTGLGSIGADEAILVELARNEAGEPAKFTEAIVNDGDFIARISYRHDPALSIDPGSVAALAGQVVAQIENPPSAAELEAAGAAEQPSALDRASERIQTDLGSRLSMEERTNPYVGVGVVAALAVLCYLIGAKLSALRAIKLDQARAASVATAHPTLDNYAASQRRWVQQRPTPTAMDAYDDQDEDDAWEEDEQPEPVGEPPPVLDFPQRSIDEKLKILKEARLREPRPEPLTPNTFVPSVDWTEEISKPDAYRERAPETPAAPEPVTRKVLLQKLRSQQSGRD